jgi:serine/threonine protein phosphatase PrpC
LFVCSTYDETANQILEKHHSHPELKTSLDHTMNQKVPFQTTPETEDSPDNSLSNLLVQGEGKSSDGDGIDQPGMNRTESTATEDEHNDGYEFSLRNSFTVSAGTTISKIEKKNNLLRAKTSSQLLSMVSDEVLDEKGKIENFINQLKAGEVQTKNLTEFRQRRLTYSQQAQEEVTSPIKQPMREPKSRTTIFASSEIGVIQEKKPPFPFHILGTYSCHGIEPGYDEFETIHEKINQDRGCIVYPYNSKRDEALLMVLDGHGEHGDKVSEFVMRQIVVSLEKDPVLNEDPIQALKNSYLTTNTALLVTDIHYMTSGCTCVTIYLKGNTLYVANAGDSRAVMARDEGANGKADNENGRFIARNLTRDHKPDDPDEQARIEQWGGFVCPPYEEGLSARVYLDPHFTMIGLAMSRSIGKLSVPFFYSHFFIPFLYR